MKQFFILSTDELFVEHDIVCQYTFKTMDTRDNCAILARANHQLAQDFGASGDKCAHLYVRDCFECRSPHKIAG